jgi:phospholipase/carboxylesterase
VQQFREQTIGRWHLKVRLPDGPPPHPVMFMLHGLAGDELAMGIFGNQIPAHFLVLAPRGLFESDVGGFSWLRRTAPSWPGINHFTEPGGQILALADAAEEVFERDLDQIHLMGFSQGAALVYSMAFQHPARVQSLAGLAGFLPEGSENLVKPGLLSGRKAFVSHGTLDQTVPVAQARHAVQVLEDAGAEVVYCEADVGHKLGASCFRALGIFYNRLESRAGASNPGL